MYNLLIVENDCDIAETFALLLVDKGYCVEKCVSMKDAILRLTDTSKDPIHLMLLDLRLPNGQGVDLIRRFNFKFPNIPLVIITADVFIETEKAIQAGAESILFKPAKQEDLCRAISEAIPRHRVRGMFKPLQDEVNWLRLEEEISKNRLEKIESAIKDSSCSKIS